MAGIIRTPKRPAGWIAPGPRPRGDDGRPEFQPADDEDLCFLTGEWRLFQKQRGHRWSLDDLVTAAIAAPHAEALGARRMLDLGCGLGSVLLMMAWRFPEADVTGIEAQDDRAAMGRRSIAWNGAESRCRILDGDLRDPNTLPQGTRFPLITGTPPYFPQGTGPKSEKTHAAACRFETRGGIEDYALAAARWLTPGGRFVVCTAALEAGRVVNAAREAGLKIIEHVDVVPREGKDVLVMVDVMGSLDSAPNEQHGSGPRSPRAESRGPSTSLRPNGPAAGEAAPPARDERRITVRDAHAQWTPDFQRLREAMGFPPLR